MNTGLDLVVLANQCTEQWGHQNKIMILKLKIQNCFRWICLHFVNVYFSKTFGIIRTRVGE